MRTRGYIVLVAVTPLWAFLFYIGWRISNEQRRLRFTIEGPAPPLLSGAAWAAVLVTLFAVFLLLFDFATWIRQRSHDRNRKAN